MEAITIEFKTDEQLKDAYMPFIKQGGLFFETDLEVNLEDVYEFQLVLPENEQPLACSGKIIWVAPSHWRSGAKRKVGIQLHGEQAKIICQQIEHHLNRTKE